MRRLSLVAVAATLASGLAFAQEKPATSPFGSFTFTSRKEPIQVSSDKLDFDYRKRRSVFRGAVEVVQGDITLRTDTLTVDYQEAAKQQELKEVAAQGNVVITQGGRKATGDRAVFDQNARTLVLTGRAVLEEGSNRINGDTIVVYPDESRMEVKGDNSRVKLVIFPGEGEAGKAAMPKAGETPPSVAKSADDGTPKGP